MFERYMSSGERKKLTKRRAKLAKKSNSTRKKALRQRRKEYKTMKSKEQKRTRRYYQRRGRKLAKAREDAPAMEAMTVENALEMVKNKMRLSEMLEKMDVENVYEETNVDLTSLLFAEQDEFKTISESDDVELHEAISDVAMDVMESALEDASVEDMVELYTVLSESKDPMCTKAVRHTYDAFIESEFLKEDKKADILKSVIAVFEKEKEALTAVIEASSCVEIIRGFNKVTEAEPQQRKPGFVRKWAGRIAKGAAVAGLGAASGAVIGGAKASAAAHKGSAANRDARLKALRVRKAGRNLQQSKYRVVGDVGTAIRSIGRGASKVTRAMAKKESADDYTISNLIEDVEKGDIDLVKLLNLSTESEYVTLVDALKESEEAVFDAFVKKVSEIAEGKDEDTVDLLESLLLNVVED